MNGKTGQTSGLIAHSYILISASSVSVGQCVVSVEVVFKQHLAAHRHADGKGKNILAFQITVAILL